MRYQRVLYADIFEIAHPPGVDATDCPFERFVLCADQWCHTQIPPLPTQERYNNYDELVGYEFDRATAFAAETIYVGAYTYGNVFRSVAMTHEVIQRNDYWPGFDG